jgi:hypothetical protein
LQSAQRDLLIAERALKGAPTIADQAVYHAKQATALYHGLTPAERSFLHPDRQRSDDLATQISVDLDRAEDFCQRR